MSLFKIIWPHGPLAEGSLWYMIVWQFSSSTVVWLHYTWPYMLVSLTLLPNCEIHDYRNCMFVFFLYHTVSIKVYITEAQQILIWTKFDFIDTEARAYSLYEEINGNLATVLLPMASLTVCRWCLSLESLTGSILISRPFLRITGYWWQYSYVKLRVENLRWQRSYSVLGKVMNSLTWRLLDLSL